MSPYLVNCVVSHGCVGADADALGALDQVHLRVEALLNRLVEAQRVVGVAQLQEKKNVKFH